MLKYTDYNISTLRPYINWIYFFFAWGLSGKPQEAKDKMRAEAEQMLDRLEKRYRTHAAFGLFDANSDGDDILIGDVRMPMLRQQHPTREGDPNLSLADFIRPLSSGVKDHIGVFATTVDLALEHDFLADDYQRMLAQTLADRLAEATAEVFHMEVRRSIWGICSRRESVGSRTLARGLPRHSSGCGLSVDARHKRQLHHRPAYRPQADWHPAHREWRHEASCVGFWTDVRTPEGALLRAWTHRRRPATRLCPTTRTAG